MRQVKSLFRGVEKMPSLSRIIKSAKVNDNCWELGRIREAIGTPSERAVEDAGREAKQIIEKAKKQAEHILEQARQKQEEILAAAHQQGFQQGFQEGMEEGKLEGRRLRQEARQVLSEALRTKKDIIAGAEKEIVRMALLIAEKVMRRQVELDPETVLAVARQALAEVKDNETVYLYVNPEQLELVRRSKQELAQVLGAATGLYILGDPEVTSGGCRLETENGWLEAGLPQQMDKLKSLVEEVLAP